MKRMARIVSICMFGLTVLVPTRASSQDQFASTGGTDISFESPIATITVTIDFLVNDPEAPGVRESFADVGQQITNFWVDGLDPLATDCLLFDLVIVTNVLPESAAQELTIDGRNAYVTTPGHHVVRWGGNEPNAPWPNTYDPYDSDQTATPGEDFTSPYEHELWAEWSGHLVDASDFAHEFGHLLGLGDDYASDGSPLPGRRGTLMDNGDQIDQALFDRVAGVIEDSGTALDCGETWQATARIQTDQTLAGGETCRNVGDAEGELEVAPDGKITGTLTAVEHETCSFGFDRTRSDLKLVLEGTATETALTVNHTSGTTAGYFPFGFFSETGLDPVAATITSPGVAHASVTRNMPNNFTVTLTLDFVCQTCDD
jgi:hypothetical protein